MNKQELVASIAEKAGMTKADAARALDATVAAVTEALRQDETVTLVGFGSFYVGERAAAPGATRAPARTSRSRRPRFRNSALAKG